MAIKKKGTSPAKKSSAANVAETAIGTALAITMMGKAKLTISAKRRLSDGTEIFIAPGIELDCARDDLDATQAAVTERVNGWMEELLAQYPDSDPIDDDDEEEEEADDEEEEDEADDEEEDEAEDDLTEADIKKMKKADLVALAEEYEIELEETAVAKMRVELIDALFSEEEEEEADDEDEEEDEDAWSEEELSEMKLDQLQEILDGWELNHPSIKKGTKLAAKKAAYIEAILEAQEEE